MVEITLLRHAFPENGGFCIDRPTGYPEYTFLHFHTPIEILQNGRLVLTQPHAVIIYDKFTPQYFKSEQPVVHDWMHFTGDISPLMKQLCFNSVYYPNNHDFITKIVAELEQEFFAKRDDNQEIMKLKIEELFLKLNRSIFQKDITDYDKGTLEKFRYLRGKMFYSLNEKWTVSRMAQEVFLSESRFFTLYKAIFGISPSADLINAKINSAKNMILFSNMTVENISNSLGYQNTTHFIRQFKQNVGVSPSVYRKYHDIKLRLE